MKMTRWIFLSLTSLAVLLTSAYALVVNRTFRTTAQFYSFTQGNDTATLLAGRTLVNLAMGRSAASTAAPSQVLALTLPCDYSAAHLVVYDQTSASILTNLADAGDLAPIVQAVTNRDNQVRFLAQFQVNQTGDAVNGLLGGYLIVAGRIHANRTNGCPESVSVNLDYDRNDRNFGDQDVSRSIDPDTDRSNRRTGLAHCVGVIYVLQNGMTTTNLIPYGQLSIRSDLPVIVAP